MRLLRLLRLRHLAERPTERPLAERRLMAARCYRIRTFVVLIFGGDVAGRSANLLDGPLVCFARICRSHWRLLLCSLR